jgi:hypothetical protein
MTGCRRVLDDVLNMPVDYPKLMHTARAHCMHGMLLKSSSVMGKAHQSLTATVAMAN